MNAASHIHGTMHGKVFQHMIGLMGSVEEWSIDEDIHHPEDEKNYLRPDIVGWSKGTVSIVIEVCLSTSSKDYGSALHFYQECEIPEYFIVDINKRKVVRFELQNNKYRKSANDTSSALEAKVFGDKT